MGGLSLALLDPVYDETLEKDLPLLFDYGPHTIISWFCGIGRPSSAPP